jgi:hypothetical protein
MNSQEGILKQRVHKIKSWAKINGLLLKVGGGFGYTFSIFTKETSLLLRSMRKVI